MSPHAHVLGAFTAEPAKPLPGPLGEYVSKAASTGSPVIYISLGSSAVPGDLASCEHFKSYFMR